MILIQILYLRFLVQEHAEPSRILLFCLSSLDTYILPNLQLPHPSHRQFERNGHYNRPRPIPYFNADHFGLGPFLTNELFFPHENYLPLDVYIILPRSDISYFCHLILEVVVLLSVFVLPGIIQGFGSLLDGPRAGRVVSLLVAL